MLGPLDKRIRRTRCAACARRRIKCHGGIPCLYCQKTKQDCVAPVNQSAQNAIFVIQTSESKGRSQQCSQATNTTNSAVTIPATMRSDQLTLLTKHFFTEFLAANSFASSVVLSPASLSSLYSSSPSLYNATIAIAALHMSHLGPISTSSTASQTQKQAKIVALKAYRASCAAVQSDLLLPTLSTNDACLWSTLFLGLFELMFDVSGNGWMQHMLYGTSAMLQMRQPAAHLAGEGRKFFLTVRVFEICRALICQERSFLAERAWRELSGRMWEGGAASDWHPKEDLYDLMICVTDLCSRAGDVVRESESQDSLPPQPTTLRSQAVEGLTIQRALYEWHSTFQTWTPQNTTTAAATTSAQQSILATLYYHAMLIFVSGIFDYRHHWNAYPAPRLSSADVRTHVSAILALSEAGLRTTPLAGLLFFVPLRVAGARARGAADKRRILEMLAEISRRSFVVADAFVLDLNAWWLFTQGVDGNM